MKEIILFVAIIYTIPMSFFALLAWIVWYKGKINAQRRNRPKYDVEVYENGERVKNVLSVEIKYQN